MPTDYVVNMIPVWQLQVSTRRTVDVLCSVVSTLVLWSAIRWITRTDRDHVFVHVVTVDIMQMPIVQIVDMIAVLDGCMSAILSVVMTVAFVHLPVSVWHCISFRSC